jgi:hypothetical protein
MKKYEEYKQALERCKKEFDFNNLAYSHEQLKQKLENIFPELKESNDEKNIKKLIDELKCSLRAANCQNDACGRQEKRISLLEWGIAWLEKQSGKTKSISEIVSIEQNPEINDDVL